MDKQKEAYKEEARELLVKLEAALLELEESPEDAGLIDRAFRAMHTIKGSGAMFEFNDIADFTHNLETVFELVRDNKVRITPELISLSLLACDQIKAMLYAHCGGEPADPGVSGNIITSLKDLVPEMCMLDASDEGAETIPADMPGNGLEGGVTFRIRFRPNQDIFKTGANPVHLLNELRELGECDIIAYLDAVPLLKEYDPEACYTYWDIVLTTGRGLNAVRDVFIFVEGDSDIRIDVIDEGTEISVDVETQRLGEILVDRGDVTHDRLKDMLGTQKRLGEILVDEAVVSSGKVGAALAEQQHVKRTREKVWKASQSSSVRVPADRLDNLVDLVGELVTVQARLSQKAVLENDPELTGIAEEVENLTSGLRDNTMSIRMVQIGVTFTSFRRLVRDLSRELEKDIALKTEGGETELDKTVIDRLNDPLVHIIRNCIDHGIESPEARKKAGKPARGTIYLSAEHSGAHVIIRIWDDGAGLDPDVIFKQAVKNNVVDSDAELSEKEILRLILSPGFTTAKTITDLSGRGVGLDVVKRGVESLRGTVDVASTQGEGTAITLKLPLTLAIIEGLLVKIGTDRFVMPLSAVEECVELSREESDRVRGRDILNVRGEIIPYIRLRESFAIDEDRPDLEHVVITGVNGSRVGFVVDEVIGGHQTVIKPLGRAMKQSEDVSGATILGDGTVALILDIDKLMEAGKIGAK